MPSQSAVEPPRQQFARLRKFVPKALHPTLRGLRKTWIRPPHLKEPYYSVYPFTQVHPVRQENLVRLASEIEARRLPGAIVECGVLDGGAAALMAFATIKSGRIIHLFDSWSGLPATSEQDGAEDSAWVEECVGSIRRVKQIMRRLNISPERLVFHKGWFAETFDQAQIEEIALLHVDADFYESVKLALETWEPRLVPGGYIQIDDYSVFRGCQSAVDEYLAIHPRLSMRSISGCQAQAYFIEKI